MIDNWVRLGLIEVTRQEGDRQDAYVWVDERPEYLKLKIERDRTQQ